MSITAMKQALDVMGNIGADLVCGASHHWPKDLHEDGKPCPVEARWHQVFRSLRQAIEQAEFDAAHDALEKEAGIHISQQTEQAKQAQPVARKDAKGNIWKSTSAKEDAPLYTAPPQRKWVNLTDGVMCDTAIYYGLMSIDWIDFARAIEAKLKEKNT